MADEREESPRKTLEGAKNVLLALSQKASSESKESDDSAEEIERQLNGEVPQYITKIFTAVYRGQLEILRPIIKQGIDPTREFFRIKKKEWAQHINKPGFMLAVKKAYALQELNAVKDSKRQGVGHLAHDWETLRTLLIICRNDQGFMKTTDQNGNTPLHTFCYRESIDQDTDWLRKKQLVEFLFSGDEIELDNGKVINTLSTEININALNDDKESAIFNAVRSKCLETVKLLIDNGAILHFKNANGNSLLHIACQTGDPIIVREMLTHFDEMGFNFKTTLLNNDKLTPLDIASELGHVGVVNELLDHKAYLETEEFLENNDHKSLKLMHRIAKHESPQHLDILDAILKKDFIMHGVNSSDRSNGNTALHIAAGLGFEFMVEMLTTAENANLLALNAQQETPVDVACREDKFDIVQILLQKEPRLIDHPNKAGMTPFQVAADSGRAKVVKILLQMLLERWQSTYNNPKISLKKKAEATKLFIARCKLITKSRKNKTSLQLAAQGGHHEVIRTIFDTLTDNEIYFKLPSFPTSESPLEFAFEKGFDETAEVLLESEFSRFTLIDLILKQKKNNIKPIIKKYYDKRCCGHDNILKFFLGEFQIFKTHIDTLRNQTQSENKNNSRSALSSSMSPRSTESPRDTESPRNTDESDSSSEDLESSSSEISQLAIPNILPQYLDSLSKVINHLELGFESLTIGNQLNRMYILLKLEHLISYITQPTKKDKKSGKLKYTLENKLKYIEKIFTEIKPYINDEQTQSLLKILGIALIGLVIGALTVGFGLGFGLTIAPWLVSIYALSSGAACATISGVVSYFFLNKKASTDWQFFTEFKYQSIQQVNNAHPSSDEHKNPTIIPLKVSGKTATKG